jgi:hypothetical protein
MNPKKKIIPVIISFLICILSLRGQAQQPKSFWIAATGGANTSLIVNQNAYGNGEMDYATTVGPTLGPGMGYFVSNKWGINTSANWARLGQNYRGMQSSGDATRKLKLDYLEFHLLAMRRILNSDQPVWIAFGPELMVLLAARQEYHRENGSPLPKSEYMLQGNTDITSRFRPVDIALNIALNRMFDVYKNRKFMLLITANMAYGLTDINRKDWSIPNIQGIYAGSHNFYIGIRAGVMYRATVKR